MEKYLHCYVIPKCSLCGEEEKLTREHKIKASILSERFEKGSKLHIGSVEVPASEGKIIQSPKSTFLKFKSKICEQCNTVRTQPADRQFDAFISSATELYGAGVNPNLIYDSIGLSSGSKEHRNLFRYFAKILCCFLTEVDSPIPRRLSEFAIGRTDITNIRIEIVEDQVYKEISGLLGNVPYAAHAGISGIGSRKTLDVERFLSACSFGPIKILFDFCLSPEEQKELRQDYPEYLTKVLGIAGIPKE